MPQIRKTVRKDLSFSVTPWQTKRGSTQTDTDQIYTEVQLPYKKAKVDESAGATIAAADRPATRQATHSSDWKSRKRSGAPAEIRLQAEQPSLQTAMDDVSPIPNIDGDATDSTGSDEASGTSLNGTAVLALLPDGQISGHLLDASSNTCYGIMGHQLTAERECTRDIEWKLLYVTILDFKSNREVSFPAERTAADAATIQAPLQMHGEEQQVIEALQGQTSTDIEFKFQCTTILVRRHCITWHMPLCFPQVSFYTSYAACRMGTQQRSIS